MKRILLCALGLCFLQFAVNAQAGKTSQKSEKSQVSCQKKIASLVKRGKYYQKLAAQEVQKGNKELAAVYTKCANAKENIADGMTKVYDSSQACQKICSSSSEIMSAVCNNNMKSCMLGSGTKGMRTSTCIKNILKSAQSCLENAKQAQKAGKADITKQYNELAKALQAKADGMKSMVAGKKAFKAGRKDIKTLKPKSAKTI